MHLVFYSKLGDEKGQFDVSDVLHSVCDKLVYRHPHIYADVEVKDEEEVKQNWEQLKLKEGGNKSVLGGVPNSMPSLVKAMRMQDKAAQVGFDWPSKDDVWDKVDEELQEFKEAEGIEKEEEFGDLLFSLVNYARWLKINPDDALEKTNKKFKYRFETIEQYAKDNGKRVEEMTLSEMDKIWDLAKWK